MQHISKPEKSIFYKIEGDTITKFDEILNNPNVTKERKIEPNCASSYTTTIELSADENDTFNIWLALINVPGNIKQRFYRERLLNKRLTKLRKIR